MKIKKILSQSRRDFRAEYECEHCGETEERSGYDDTNFHHNVIPNMTCNGCGRVANKDYHPIATKYPEGYVV